MIIKSLSGADLNKFRRLRVFGCSLSHWRYPTWADILAQDIPHCEYFNLAWPGAGHQFLQAQYSQWTQQIPLDETDLVIIQWPTYYREDRYLKHPERHRPWITPGNIFTQDDYPAAFLEVCNRRGFVVTSLAIQDLVMRDLENSDATALCFNAVAHRHQDSYTGFSRDIHDDFSDISNLYSVVQDRNAQFDMYAGLSKDPDHPKWPDGYQYNLEGELEQDYHPTVAEHARFLRDIMAHDLSDTTADWAQKQHTRIVQTQSVDHIPEPMMRNIL